MNEIEEIEQFEKFGQPTIFRMLSEENYCIRQTTIDSGCVRKRTHTFVGHDSISCSHEAYTKEKTNKDGGKGQSGRKPLERWERSLDGE